MKKEFVDNNSKQEAKYSAEKRLIGRQLARQLSFDEIETVSGGMMHTSGCCIAGDCPNGQWIADDSV